jgi:hypothetical protein
MSSPESILITGGGGLEISSSLLELAAHGKQIIGREAPGAAVFEGVRANENKLRPPI